MLSSRSIAHSDDFEGHKLSKQASKQQASSKQASQQASQPASKQQAAAATASSRQAGKQQQASSNQRLPPWKNEQIQALKINAIRKIELFPGARP